MGNENKLAIDELCKGYINGDITIEKLQEQLKRATSQEEKSIASWINDEQNIECKTLKSIIENSPKPEEIDFYKLVTDKNKRPFEIAPSGLNIIMANSGHCKTLFSINIFCELLLKRKKLVLFQLKSPQKIFIKKY